MNNIVRNIWIAREQLTGILPKFFPSVTEPQHQELQLIELKAEFEGLAAELETNFNGLQMTMRRNRESFLDVIGFVMNDQDPSMTLLREAPTLTLQSLIVGTPNKHELLLELISQVCAQATAIVARFEAKLHELEPACIYICLRKRDTTKYSVVLGFREYKFRLSMKKSYEEGYYVNEFRKELQERIKREKGVIVKPLEKPDNSVLDVPAGLQDLFYSASRSTQKIKMETPSDLFELLETFSFDQTRGLLALTKYHLYSSLRIYNKVVQEKYIMLNKGFDWQLLSFDDVTTGKPTDGHLYNNPLCSHFDSFSRYSIQKTYEKCRKCNQQIIADPTKLYLYENKFLALLKDNFLNSNQEKVLYSFKNNVFFVGKPFNFYNYSHFAEYIRATRVVLDRPYMPLLLENYKAYLSTRLFQQSDYLTVKEAVVTPVKGLYCKHISFFDLSRVYQDFLKAGSNPNSQFECPICECEMPFNELVFLTEVVDLMNYIVKKGFIATEKNLVYLSLCHPKKELKIVVRKQKETEETVLPFYDNLMDPRLKFIDKEYEDRYHQKLIDDYNQHRIEPQGQFDNTEG